MPGVDAEEGRPGMKSHFLANLAAAATTTLTAAATAATSPPVTRFRFASSPPPGAVIDVNHRSGIKRQVFQQQQQQ